MYIRNEQAATSRLYEPWMDDYVADVVADLPGDERGVVFAHPTQITEDVGEQLCDRYDPISEYEADTE
jgi:hypothetical protein